VGVELPKAYMWRHWKSLAILLGPVMAYGWLVSSAFIYWLIPALNFVDALCVGACVTATDPVLASSVVGKGKFAKRVPGHLRNILSAESGSNDGMAFPFLYIALYIILDKYNAGQAVKDFILIAVLYEVILGTVLGAVIGIVWRKAIKFCERRYRPPFFC
jgi:sodium/hydrogen antiporter